MRYSLTKKGIEFLEHMSNPDNYEFDERGNMIAPPEAFREEANALLTLSAKGDSFSYNPRLRMDREMAPALLVRVLERKGYIEHTGQEIFDEQVDLQKKKEELEREGYHFLGEE